MMEAVCMHVWAPHRVVIRMAVLHHQIQLIVFLYSKILLY
jgi:hypothetical protein